MKYKSHTDIESLLPIFFKNYKFHFLNRLCCENKYFINLDEVWEDVNDFITF
jgi:hypothetical protein